MIHFPLSYSFVLFFRFSSLYSIFTDLMLQFISRSPSSLPNFSGRDNHSDPQSFLFFLSDLSSLWPVIWLMRYQLSSEGGGAFYRTTPSPPPHFYVSPVLQGKRRFFPVSPSGHFLKGNPPPISHSASPVSPLFPSVDLYRGGNLTFFPVYCDQPLLGGFSTFLLDDPRSSDFCHASFDFFWFYSCRLYSFLSKLTGNWSGRWSSAEVWVFRFSFFCHQRAFPFLFLTVDFFPGLR